MLVKFAGAAGGFIVGMGLSVVGYVPNVEQSDSTIMGLHFMMVGLPAILMTVSALVYKRYYHLHEGFDQDQAGKETQTNVATAEA
ncbi:hypothetical protein VCRA2112O187_14210001 [Vibrio crassostreae]|nr:hypothetical protein VCRA2112O187_14210001 [Vibrio crassostreae]